MKHKEPMIPWAEVKAALEKLVSTFDELSINSMGESRRVQHLIGARVLKHGARCFESSKLQLMSVIEELETKVKK